MGDAVELLLDRVVDLRDGVAAGDGGDAAEEIEILPAGAVVDELPLAAAQLDRLVVEEPDAGKEAFLVASDEIGRIVCQRSRQQIEQRVGDTSVMPKAPASVEWRATAYARESRAQDTASWLPSIAMGEPRGSR